MQAVLGIFTLSIAVCDGVAAVALWSEPKKRFAPAMVMQRSRFDQLSFLTRYDHFLAFDAASNQQPV